MLYFEFSKTFVFLGQLIMCGIGEIINILNGSLFLGRG